MFTAPQTVLVPLTAEQAEALRMLPQLLAALMGGGASAAPAQPGGDILNQAQAAEYLGLTNERTLAAWRLRRQGPAYVKLGSSVRYKRTDLDAYLSGATTGAVVEPEPGRAVRRRQKDPNYRPGAPGSDGFGDREP